MADSQGPATKNLCKRAYTLFHDERFVRLKDISVSHLYNLRGRRQYISHATTWTKTRPTTVPIGERRKPSPEGKPGYIRVDSVHQGDQDKEKGVYHINLVDEVTQWELVGCVQGISEAFLAPLLGNIARTVSLLCGGVSLQTMGLSISTISWQAFSTSSRLPRQNLVQDSPTITLLSKERMEASFESIWGTRISHDITRRPSTSFTKRTSTGI